MRTPTATAKDQKKQIPNTPVAGLELTAAQATKVNAWIRSDRKKAASFLSSKQQEVLQP